MTHQQRLLDPTSGEPPAVQQIERPIQDARVVTEASKQAPQEDVWLDLLLPDALPAEVVLDEVESRRLHALLSDLLHALELDLPFSIKKLEALLSDLAKLDGVPVEIKTTGLPLTPFQASDYDRYFRVNRLSTANPATAMVRSLLQTVHAVSQLFHRSKDLPEIHVQRQVAGFASQIHLLARAFGLERLR